MIGHSIAQNAKREHCDYRSQKYVRNLVEHEKPLRPSAKNPIGLFADRPDIIDEMMVDVIHTRSLPLRAPNE